MHDDKHLETCSLFPEINSIFSREPRSTTTSFPKEHTLTRKPHSPLPTAIHQQKTKMHWLLTLTAVVSTASLCAAVPGRTPISRLFSRQDDFPLCSSGSDTCFGASSSTDCRTCEETCFSLNGAGELCKASCLMTTRPGSGTPITDCACNKKCHAGR
jgi:hypothetical protein